MSLKKQTISGLIWTFADTFLLRGLSFAATIVLARLLGPADFGLIGMIAVFVAIGTSLVDSGLSSSIIRTKNSNDEDYSTVFYLNFILSIVVYILLFAAAPLISDFYDQEILTNIIRLYCLSFIISAFSSVQLAILNKEMKFRKMMQINIPGTLLGIVIGIWMGYKGYGVWSIVWLYLITQLIQSLLLWIFSDWKPSLTFSLEKMKFHYNFGYKIMLSGLLDTVFKNIYNVIIGKFFSVQALGYYERAHTFNEYPVSALTSIINKVSYPLLANIQDEKEKISAVYKQLLNLTFFVTAPLMLIAAAVAKPLFLLLLGELWLPAVPFFQIISLSCIFYPIHSYNISILKVYGRSDLFLKLEVIKKIVIVISVLISLPFGIYSLVWSGVIVSLIALAINTSYSSSMINYNIKQQVSDMMPVMIISLIVAFACYFLMLSLSDFSLYVQIVIPSVVGVSLYVIINYLIKSSTLLYIVKIIKERKL